MFDQRLFMKTLSRFSVVLPEHHDLDAAALAELTRSVTAVLGLGGSGVTMAEEGQLQFVTAVSPDSKELERSQEEHQEGPCRDAYETGEVVRVTDVRQESARWPHYSATAIGLGVAGVAGIPMRLDDQIIGALNLYSPSRATGRVRTSRSPGYWPTRRPATWSTPPSRASRSSPASSCNRRWNLGSSSSRPRGSPPSSTPSQLIRPTSSCAGTPETTTPACGESPKQSLPWDSRSEPMRPSVCSCGAALNIGGPCPISSGTIDSIRQGATTSEGPRPFHISPQLFHRLQPPCVDRPGERVFSPHEAPGWKALGGPGRPGLLHRAGFALPSRRARAVCHRCEVAQTCLNWAVESRQQDGMWGGQPDDERRAQERRNARARRADPVAPGH